MGLDLGTEAGAGVGVGSADAEDGVSTVVLSIEACAAATSGLKAGSGVEEGSFMPSVEGAVPALLTGRLMGVVSEVVVGSEDKYCQMSYFLSTVEFR